MRGDRCGGCGIYQSNTTATLPIRHIDLCDNCAVILRQESKRICREITERNTKRNEAREGERE